MAIVSSIVATDIKNQYNEGANYLRNFLAYAEATSTIDSSKANHILKGLAADKAMQTTNLNDNAILDEICEYIHTLGFQTEKHIGLSNFKISVGVLDPNDNSEFILGLCVDSAPFYNTKDVFDQYVLRPNVLNVFGWEILSIYHLDWALDSKSIQKQIRLALPINESVAAEPEIQNELQITAIDYNHSKILHLEKTQGDDIKTWRVEKLENKLKIKFGIKNSNQREHIKSYDTTQAMNEDFERLVQDKLSDNFEIVNTLS